MIDYSRLLISVKNNLLEEQWNNYDLERIVNNAVLCWDDTAVKVACGDFVFIFDIVSYDCLKVQTNDLMEEL